MSLNAAMIKKCLLPCHVIALPQQMCILENVFFSILVVGGAALVATIIKNRHEQKMTLDQYVAISYFKSGLLEIHKMVINREL